MTVTRQSLPTYDRRANAAVRLLRRLSKDELAQVVALMPELRAIAVSISQRESTADYWHRVLREERGSYQPTLDDEFLDGVTYRQYFALSEVEQDTFWNQIFAEED